MIPRQTIPRSDRGAALLAALCLASVFILSLGSYVLLCNTSLNVSTRALMFNRGAELTEAGIEQAMYAINNNDWSSTLWSTAGSTATATNLFMTSSGLAGSSSSSAPITFGNGMQGAVTVTVTNYNSGLGTYPSPQITAQATMTLPGYAGGTSKPTVTQTQTYSAPSGTLTGAIPVFVNALASITGRVNITGGGTYDSYNSVLPVTSLWNGAQCTIRSVGTTSWTSIGAGSNSIGTTFTATGAGTGTGTAYVAYSLTVPGSPGTPGSSGYSAVLLSQDSTSTSATVRLGSATVKGYAVGYDYQTPSSTNWLSYGVTGALKGPTTPATTLIDSSRILTEYAPYQPLILENSTSGYPYSSTISLPTSVASAGFPNYGMRLDSTGTLGTTAQTSPIVYNTSNGISLGAGNIITVNGPIILISYGNISITGGGGFQLNSPNASVQIFQEYGSVTISGSGGFQFSATYKAGAPAQVLPKKYAIMGTNINWSTVTIGTTGNFYGVVYFPYETITVSATGTIFGSIIGDTVKVTGSPTFHYDMALRSPPPSTFYNPVIYSDTKNPLLYGAAFANLNYPVTVGSLSASNE